MKSILLTGAFAFAAYVVFLESLIRQAILNVVLPVYVQKELGRSETEHGRGGTRLRSVQPAICGL